MIRAPSVGCGAFLLVICCAAPVASAAKAQSPSRRVELVVARAPGTEEMQRFETALRSALVTKGLGLASARKEVITLEDVVLAMTASPDEAASIVARVYIDFAAADHAALTPRTLGPRDVSRGAEPAGPIFEPRGALSRGNNPHRTRKNPARR